MKNSVYFIIFFLVSSIGFAQHYQGSHRGQNLPRREGPEHRHGPIQRGYPILPIPILIPAPVVAVPVYPLPVRRFYRTVPLACSRFQDGTMSCAAINDLNLVLRCQLNVVVSDGLNSWTYGGYQIVVPGELASIQVPLNWAPVSFYGTATCEA